MTGAIVAVVAREFIRFRRQIGRLVATFARPLLWLIVIGSGFEKVVPTFGTVSYKQFLLPGIFGMVLLFSTMLSSLATVHDREFGPIRMLLIAPLPRSVAVLAKTISSTLLAFVQAVMLMPLIWILGLRPTLLAIVEFLGGVMITSLALSGLGMVIASRMKSVENFAGIMNFLMFPLFFLSSSLYPASSLPGFLQPLVRADPLTYGVDLMRHPLLHGLYPANLGTDYTATFDVWVLLFMAFILVTLACLVFGEEDHLGRILLVESPRPKKGPREWKKRDRSDSSELSSVPAAAPPPARPSVADD